MIFNETCLHGGVAPTQLLINLHENQGGSGRHKCPNCAYEHGYNLGSSRKWASYDEYCKTLTNYEICPNGSISPSGVLNTLGINQGGSGRHKCTNCAFKNGFIMALKSEISDLTSNKPENVPVKLEVDLQLVSPPVSLLKVIEPSFNGVEVDFVQKEVENKKLGLSGELFVLNHEVKTLIDGGRLDLAKLVRHVSIEDGDGLGFDILSYDISGAEKRIEVKTTRSGIDRPFYITDNELKCSTFNSKSYCIYRLFLFDSLKKTAKYYAIYGDLTKSLNLQPVVFNALPKI